MHVIENENNFCLLKTAFSSNVEMSNPGYFQVSSEMKSIVSSVHQRENSMGAVIPVSVASPPR